MLAYRQPGDDDELEDPYASGFFGSQTSAATLAPSVTSLSSTKQPGGTDLLDFSDRVDQPQATPYSVGPGSGVAESTYQPTYQPPSTGTATVGTQTGTATGGAGDTSSKYTQFLDAIRATSDPMQQAQARDALARSLYSEFSAAGHDVKWDGDVLVVEGRRYTVGGGVDARTGGLNSGVVGSDLLGAGIAGPGGAVTTPTGTVSASSTGSVPSGWDAAKVAAGHQSPKYAALDNLQTLSAQLQSIPDEASRKALAEQTLTAMIPELESMGGDVLEVRGEKILFDAGDGKGPLWIDTIQDIEGSALPQWIEPGADDAGAMRVTGGTDLAAPGTAQGAAGVTLGPSDPGFWVTLSNGQQVPYNHPLATGGGSTTGTPAGPGGGAGAAPAWMTAPTYTPGEIPTDVPSFDYNQLLGSMGTYTPETYATGDMGVGPLEGDTESLIASILRNPESMDAKTIAQLQARNREEQADLLRQADEDLIGMGYDAGIAGSPWLASERSSQRRARDEAVMRGNRDVEVAAAQTNAADRRAAGQLGAAYVESKGARRRGEEALRQSAATLNSQNAFNAARLRSDNVTAAAKTTLDAAAAQGDRLALREAVNQKATELGISRDKLLTDYVLAQMDDATDRYGIDVGAALQREGFAIDREKLAQAGREFKEELAFRIQALAQERELQLSQLGLGYASLSNTAEQQGIDNYFRAAGL
jgi:hypothetical protein